MRGQGDVFPLVEQRHAGEAVAIAARGGFVNGRCPYHKAAEISKLPCEADRRTIELLLGHDVEQINRIVDGAARCEYLVRTPARPQIIEIQ